MQLQSGEQFVWEVKGESKHSTRKISDQTLQWQCNKVQQAQQAKQDSGSSIQDKSDTHIRLQTNCHADTESCGKL